MILNKTYDYSYNTDVHRSQRHSDNIGKGALRMEVHPKIQNNVSFTSLFIINIFSGLDENPKINSLLF